MSGFISSFLPLFQRLKKYLLEIVILFVALILTITAIIIYVESNQDSQGSTTPTLTSSSTPVIAKNVSIDLSGSVKNPGLYKAEFGARLKDVIDKAGGLSDEADTTFFKRNFNLARIVSDQEKIYVPSILEINNGVFSENQRMLDYSSPGILSDKEGLNNVPTDNKISINLGTLEELDQLPGIGQAIANKIIANRPYSTIDELLTKKAVNKTLFDNIKGSIGL